MSFELNPSLVAKPPVERLLFIILRADQLAIELAIQRHFVLKVLQKPVIYIYMW